MFVFIDSEISLFCRVIINVDTVIEYKCMLIPVVYRFDFFFVTLRDL